MRDELIEANRRIATLLGVTPRTFAYPCGQTFVGRGPGTQSYVPVVADLFLAGRGWRDEASNDPAFVDLAQTLGVEMDDRDFARFVRGWTRPALAARGSCSPDTTSAPADVRRRAWRCSTSSSPTRRTRRAASGLPRWRRRPIKSCAGAASSRSGPAQCFDRSVDAARIAGPRQAAMDATARTVEPP